jgi:tetratricopeptide (TPR) repeat protein
MGACRDTLPFYERGHEILQEHLPSNHPDLAISYSDIASVYRRTGEYSIALSILEQALAIEQNSLPANHPALAASYNNIELLYKAWASTQKHSPSSSERSRSKRKVSLPLIHI